MPCSEALARGQGHRALVAIHASRGLGLQRLRHWGVRPLDNDMQYFKRHWDESRGDAHDDWGTSTWYFETEADMRPTRQIEVYANGRVLHYDRQHVEDVFGGSSETALDPTEFAPFAIVQSEFEQVWNSQKPFNR